MAWLAGKECITEEIGRSGDRVIWGAPVPQKPYEFICVFLRESAAKTLLFRWPDHPMNRSPDLLREPYPAQKIVKARVVAYSVEHRFHAEPGQTVGAF